MLRVDRITQRLEALNKSAAAASKDAGFGVDYVRDILRGKVKDPGSWRLRQLAAALDCSPDYLLGLTEDPAPRAQGEVSTSVSLLRIRGELLAGYHDVHGDNRWDRIVAEYTFPTLVEQPEQTEWLELVAYPQLAGRLPLGALLHVVSHRPGERLRGPVIVKQYRDERTLFSRSVRLAQNGRFHPVGEWPTPYQGITDEDFQELTLTGTSGAYSIESLVRRAYLLFDGTEPIPVLMT